ncbi:hypothetical protein SETIT_5G022100v2 [Setaria italica]|uniref:C2H2-type domain-containing protein n=1 Tax=Setaria italica TaxID=4555 RepID=K3XT51_SETIT|nr:hypothetical protein SETIT_5G022100v2 [Setaria italica]
MDPSSYPTKDKSSDNSIFPLHQALRGNVEAPPPQPYPVFTHVPLTRTVASSGIIQSPARNEQEIMHSFLTVPLSEFLSVDERVQVASLEPPSITSLLEGDPTAILQAHLDIAGVLDPGPIFHDPTSFIPKENEMRKPLGSSSSQCDPYGNMTYAKPNYFDQSPMSSSHFLREEQVPSVVNPSDKSNDYIRAAMRYKFEFNRVQQYTCQLCNATFTTPQTYQGHMSLHKERE